MRLTPRVKLLQQAVTVNLSPSSPTGSWLGFGDDAGLGFRGGRLPARRVGAHEGRDFLQGEQEEAIARNDTHFDGNTSAGGRLVEVWTAVTATGGNWSPRVVVVLQHGDGELATHLDTLLKEGFHRCSLRICWNLGLCTTGVHVDLHLVLSLVSLIFSSTAVSVDLHLV